MKLANHPIACRFLSGSAPALLSLLCWWLTLPGQAAESQRLRGHVPAAVAHAQAVDRLPAEKVLRLAIGLPLRDGPGLTALLQQLYDPASPNYRQWLTPEQFTARFGPAKADYQAVTDFAQAHGLRVTVRHPNRLVLNVEGAVPAIEKAFQVTLRNYPHPTESRTFYAPDSEPVLDLAVPVLHIAGLDNYSLPQPNYRLQPLDQTALATPNTGSGSGSNGSFRGRDFRAAYMPGVKLTGVGQSVGLLQFDGYYAADITRYETEAGLPHVPLIDVMVDGGPTSVTKNNVEVCLDIEMALSTAPGLSAIYVYEAPNDSSFFVGILSRMANDNLCKQLSCSWYLPHGTMDPAADQIFQQMAVQGQSFFNASGDFDAWCGLISFPGDTPYITQVGGTTLTTTGPGGAYVSETVWNRGNGTGTAGGISTQYAIPSYQVGLDMTTNQGSTTMRNIPDVALTAENVYVTSFDPTYGVGTYVVVGGTSCSAPLWAGLMALINEQATGYGRPTLGFVNPAVYAIGHGGSYLSAFHDITVSNNLNSCSPDRFHAVAGYDLCTGWGTPAGSGLLEALAGPSDAALDISEGGFVVAGGPGGPFDVTAHSFWLTNSGASTFDWSLSNTSLWFTASSTGGSLAPGATVDVVFQLNPTASNAVPGTYSATACFTNLSSGMVQSRDLVLLVLTAPVITTQPENQWPPMHGTATFSVGVAGAPPLSYFWKRNGALLAGATQSSYSVTNVQLADTGTRFSCLVSNAYGTVLSADAVLTPYQVLDHFAWSAIAPTQAVNMPFLVTITAQDAEGATVPNFNWFVNLSGWTNGAGGIPGRVPVEPAVSGFTVGISYGAVTVRQIASNMVLLADHDHDLSGRDMGHRGSSNPFAVTAGSHFAGDVVFGHSYRQPWGLADKERILTMVFGTNWQNRVFELNTNDFIQMLSSNTRFLFLDGSTDSEAALGSFLSSYRSYISNWVAAGGSLWVNSAPTNPASATNLYLLFGVNLHPEEQYSARAVDPSHPIFAGPFLPAGTAFTVVPFGEAWVDGPGLTPLLVNTDGEPVLAEKPFGAGHVMFSGMTLPESHSLQPEGTNLLANILHYAASGGWVSNLPPSILRMPASQAVAAGDGASFMVIALGSAPLTYSWRRNGVVIAGASLPTYSMNNVLLADSGAQYSCLVSNAYGTTTSLVAVLTVSNLWPAIVAQPLSRAVLAGGTAAFSVAATGASPVSYFWKRNGAFIAGATLSSYTTNDVQAADSGAQFSCLLSNAYGATLSSNATLIVTTGTWVEINFDDGVAPSVFSSATPLTSRYASLGAVFEGPGGSDGGAILNKIGWWILSGFSGPNFLAFNAYGALQGGATPRTPETIRFASPATRVRLLAGTLDSGNGMTLSAYDNANSLLAASTIPLGRVLAPVEVAASGIAKVVISSPAPTLAVDDVAFILETNLVPVILAHPQSVAASVGDTVTFNVGASGLAPLSYCWRRDGMAIAGASLSSYTTNNVQLADSGAQFSCLVSNAYGTAQSSNALLTIVLTVDHFAWSAIGPTQSVSTPFAVSLTALDAWNQTVTGFSGTVTLAGTSADSGGGPVALTPANSGNFIGGLWTGSVAVLQVASNVVLSASDGAGHAGSSNPFQVVVLVSWYSFEQTNPITINDDGSATPYPSVLVVSNLAGTVQAATVTVRDLAHGRPEDVGMLLVGPQGQRIELMADAGGGQPIAGVTLTFDDGVGAGLTAEPIVSGTYKPGPCGSGDVFGAPAPAGPYGAALAGLWGANPNGDWGLYVQDDAPGDSGYIGGGWGLRLGLVVSPAGLAPVIVPGTLKYLANGQFQFQLAGCAGCTYVIEAGADLWNWKVLKTVSLLGTTTSVLDVNTNAARRFYRARLVQ